MKLKKDLFIFTVISVLLFAPFVAMEAASAGGKILIYSP